MAVPGIGWWRTTLVLAAVGAGLAWAAGCAEREDPAVAALPGYPIYRASCRRCHGAGGDNVRASRMAGRRIDFTAPAFRDTTTVDQVRRVVAQGKGRMKGFAEKLEPAEIEAVSRFVLALPRKP